MTTLRLYCGFQDSRVLIDELSSVVTWLGRSKLFLQPNLFTQLKCLEEGNRMELCLGVGVWGVGTAQLVKLKEA